jgi:hypothetical protein
MAAIGDLNSDGFQDLAVGAPENDAGGTNTGCVYILFLSSNNGVQSAQKISNIEGGSQVGFLDTLGWFGSSLASLGDLDNDGIPDIAVGAERDDDGIGPGTYSGCVWVLFLQADGMVKSHLKLGRSTGIDSITSYTFFGSAVSHLGILNGRTALAVGAFGSGSERTGAVYIVFITATSVDTHHRITTSTGGFEGILNKRDYFGFSVSKMGDVNHDGFMDLAVGSPYDDDGDMTNSGAIWIIFLSRSGQAQSHQKVSAAEGDVTGELAAVLSANDGLGCSVSALGDLDGDGNMDLASGGCRDDDSGQDTGAVLILFLRSDGVVRAIQKISSATGSFDGSLVDGSEFGSEVAIFDLNGDGRHDLLVGSVVGTVWILQLDWDFCPFGTYRYEFGEAVLCLECRAGSYQNTPAHKLANCVKCLPGFYQNEVGAKSCIACPEKTYQNTSGEAW